jgi:hypothetical protein
MGTVHIPTLLDGILEATAAKAGAEARITTLRAALEAEGRRRLEVEGAAPSWNAPKLGKVRLDPPGEFEAYVEDSDTFASWAAEHHPTEVTATLTINASDLEDALQALTFIGAPVHESRLEVRPAWRKPFLDALALDVVEERDASSQLVRTVVAADTKTGETVPGIGATRDAAKLVVSLDRDRRTAAITEATNVATAVIEAASDDTEEAEVDAAALDARRKELEGMHATSLATIAKAIGLGASGTKAALAERIARTELATGNVIRTATELIERHASKGDDQGRIIDDLRASVAAAEADPRPLDPALASWASSPLPEGTEVEEVSEVPSEDDSGEIARAYVESVGTAGPLADEEPQPEEVASALEAHDDRVVTSRLRENLDSLSREVLRQYAKAIGLSAAGAKADVIDRLVDEGVTVSAVNEHARRSRA